MTKMEAVEAFNRWAEDTEPETVEEEADKMAELGLTWDEWFALDPGTNRPDDDPISVLWKYPPEGWEWAPGKPGHVRQK